MLSQNKINHVKYLFGYEPDYPIYHEQCDYNYIVEDFGHVAIQVDDEDYQGDSRILFDNEDNYGILIFGWGSCSGCDALQRCESWEELTELYDELLYSVTWFDTKEECIDYLNTHDWEGDFCWNEKTREFINRAIEYLTKPNEEKEPTFEQMLETYSFLTFTNSTFEEEK